MIGLKFAAVLTATLVSSAAAHAETRIFYCKETTLHDKQGNAQRLDPTQVNFVEKDGSFQMDGVYFNGKVYAYETEVAAFVDNAMYKGFVSLKYTGPATAEMTLGMPRFPDTTGERLTTGTCRIQIK